MAKQRKHKSKQRRGRGRFAKVYQLLSAILIAAAIIAGCIVFFKVQNISVAGNHRYTEEEIIAATGIQIEDNLYTMNKFDIRAKVAAGTALYPGYDHPPAAAGHDPDHGEGERSGGRPFPTAANGG